MLIIGRCQVRIARNVSGLPLRATCSVPATRSFTVIRTPGATRMGCAGRGGGAGDTSRCRCSAACAALGAEDIYTEELGRLRLLCVRLVRCVHADPYCRCIPRVGTCTPGELGALRAGAEFRPRAAQRTCQTSAPYQRACRKPRRPHQPCHALLVYRVVLPSQPVRHLGHAPLRCCRGAASITRSSARFSAISSLICTCRCSPAAAPSRLHFSRRALAALPVP